jgi:precorrin-6B methylase 2
VVAVDVTVLPVGAIVVAASTTESRATELLLEHLTELGVTDRLELVPVDRGTTVLAARSMSARVPRCCSSSSRQRRGNQPPPLSQNGDQGKPV